MTQAKKTDIIGKRLLGIDFGMKRVGLAVADELGITVTPRITLDFESPNFWSNIERFIKAERIAAIVLGVPYRNDNEETSVIQSIREFAEQLKSKTGLEVYDYDESYSSVDASRTMINIGKKKKKRAEKGEKDKIAAALILTGFLNQFE